MSKLNIAIIDDSDDRIKLMQRNIKEGGGKQVEFTCLSGDNIIGLVAELRRRAARESGDEYLLPSVDRAELVLIDQELDKLEGAFAMLKGSTIAQMLRSHSTCGPIVAINRWPIRTFMLRPEPNEGLSSDVFLHIDDLSSTGLWSERRTGLNAWYWPLLPKLAMDFELRVADVANSPDASIPELLGVPEEWRVHLPPEHSHLPADMSSVTARQLVASLTREGELGEEQCNRIAATAIGSWLNYGVIPSQSQLIDAPHLVRACPSLLTGKPSKGTLNKLATRDADKLPLRLDAISEYEFGKSHWSDRPVWWTRPLLSDQDIPEVREPWTRAALDYVFLEDLSQWSPGEKARGYAAEGRFTERFLAGPEAIGVEALAYEPRGRLAAAPSHRG